MSNKLVNAVIALVENNSKVAREMLRSPELKIPIGEVQSRLYDSLTKREKKAQIEALMSVLSTSLRIEPGKISPEDPSPWSDKEKNIYFLGVARMESIVEELIEKLTADLSSERDSKVPLPEPQ